MLTVNVCIKFDNSAAIPVDERSPMVGQNAQMNVFLLISQRAILKAILADDYTGNLDPRTSDEIDTNC